MQMPIPRLWVSHGMQPLITFESLLLNCQRALVSDIAKTFDVLGWFSPSMVKAKILLQRCWEQKLDWDDPVPSSIRDSWYNWRSELHLLAERHISRCYFDKTSQIVSLDLHGFSDASEHAYTAVVYLCMTDSLGNVLLLQKLKWPQLSG